MDYSTPGFPVHHQFLELAQTHVCWVGDAIQPSHPLSPTSPAFNLSQHQGLFQWVNSSYQVAKVSSFSFSISLSNEYPGLIFFKMDWFYLLAVLGTLKNLLHHHSLKASILQCSALFMVQLSHPYITTGKTIALIRWTFVFMANPKRMASELECIQFDLFSPNGCTRMVWDMTPCYLLNATKVSPLLNIFLSL